MGENEARYLAEILSRTNPDATVAVAELGTGIWRVSLEPPDGSPPRVFCYQWEVVGLLLREQEQKHSQLLGELVTAVLELHELVTTATGGGRSQRRGPAKVHVPGRPT